MGSRPQVTPPHVGRPATAPRSARSHPAGPGCGNPGGARVAASRPAPPAGVRAVRAGLPPRDARLPLLALPGASSSKGPGSVAAGGWMRNCQRSLAPAGSELVASSFTRGTMISPRSTARGPPPTCVSAISSRNARSTNEKSHAGAVSLPDAMPCCCGFPRGDQGDSSHRGARPVLRYAKPALRVQLVGNAFCV